MTYQEKLLKRRLEQEEKILKMHNKGINNRASRIEFSEEQNPSSENIPNTYNRVKSNIKNKIDDIIKNNSIKKVEHVKITEPIDGETLEEKKIRLKEARRKIYVTHRNSIDKKYKESKEKLNKYMNKVREGVKEHHKDSLTEEREALDEALEEAEDDVDERAEARDSYNNGIELIKKDYKDIVNKIIKEEKVSIDALDEEYNIKISDIEGRYKKDIEDIDRNIFDDIDITISQKESEAEAISFNTLEEYLSDEDNIKNTRNSLNTATLNATQNAFMSNETYDTTNYIPKVLTLLIGVGALFTVLFIGNLVLSTIVGDVSIGNVIDNSSNIYGVISTTLFNGDNIPFILLFGPLVIVTIFYFFRLGFGDRGDF